MYGLVLEGGGAKGSYHIGVWKALIELDIQLSAVTGTSVGALIGAMIVQGKFDISYKVWSNISPQQVMEIDGDTFSDFINFKLKFNLENIEIYLKLIEKHIKNKGISVKPLKEMLEKNIDEDLIRNSSIKFGLVTVSLTDKKPLELFVDDIPKGKLVDYLLASSFLPTFEPMKLDGKRFIDGGFHDNLPINLMTKTGVEKIIAVKTKAIGIRKQIKDKSAEILYIIPSGELCKVLEFDAEKSRKNIEMGYLDTLKAFGKLEGDEYYFKEFPDNNYFINILLKLDEISIEDILKTLRMDEPTNQRTLFEEAIPMIAKQFNLDRESNYTDIFIQMIEYVASHLNIERLKIYDYIEISDIILHKGIDEEMEYNLRDVFETLKNLKKNIIKESTKMQISYLFIEIFNEYHYKNMETIPMINLKKEKKKWNWWLKKKNIEEGEYN